MVIVKTLWNDCDKNALHKNKEFFGVGFSNQVGEKMERQIQQIL